MPDQAGSVPALCFSLNARSSSSKSFFSFLGALRGLIFPPAEHQHVDQDILPSLYQLLAMVIEKPSLLFPPIFWNFLKVVSWLGLLDLVCSQMKSENKSVSEDFLIPD